MHGLFKCRDPPDIGEGNERFFVPRQQIEGDKAPTLISRQSFTINDKLTSESAQMQSTCWGSTHELSSPVVCPEGFSVEND